MEEVVERLRATCRTLGGVKSWRVSLVPVQRACAISVSSGDGSRYLR